jgi:hypothetical protein
MAEAGHRMCSWRSYKLRSMTVSAWEQQAEHLENECKMGKEMQNGSDSCEI